MSRSCHRAGFTLVEAVITVSLLVLLTSSAVLAARGVMGAFRAAQDSTDVETRVRRALDRVVFELLSASRTQFDPVYADLGNDFGTHQLQFAKPQSWPLPALNFAVDEDEPEYGQPLYGPPSSIGFEYATGELNDDIDNDGNGLVDDGVLVLTRDVGGADQRTILCRGVREMLEGETANGADDNGNGVTDERGFNVHRVDDALFVRLSMEEPGENGTIVRTLETCVRLRN